MAKKNYKVGDTYKTREYGDGVILTITIEDTEEGKMTIAHVRFENGDVRHFSTGVVENEDEDE